MQLLNWAFRIRFIIRNSVISINLLVENFQFSHKLSSDVISIMLWRILRDRRFVNRSTLLVLGEKKEIFLNQAREILIYVERTWDNNERCSVIILVISNISLKQASYMPLLTCDTFLDLWYQFICQWESIYTKRVHSYCNAMFHMIFHRYFIFHWCF